MFISCNVASGKTFVILTKLLPSFIQNPDLNCLLTVESVELIFNCCAFFSLPGVTKLPIINVKKLKNKPTKISEKAIFFIDKPLDLITVNSELNESCPTVYIDPIKTAVGINS